MKLEYISHLYRLWATVNVGKDIILQMMDLFYVSPDIILILNILTVILLLAVEA